jgi:chemotaxis-related protein WspB
VLALTFQIGADRLALDIRQVREVVPRVRLARAAGAPAWLAGTFVYRGQAIPVIDLHRLLGAGDCPPHLSSRIILVPRPGPRGEEGLVGLLAARVADLREVPTGGPALALPRAPGQPDLGDPVVVGGAVLHLIDLDRLLPEAAPGAVAALPPAEGAG